MTRPEPDGPRPELDALLADRTPAPGSDDDRTAGAPTPPVRPGRLESWLRRSGDEGGTAPAKGSSGGSAGDDAVGGGLGILREVAVESIRPNDYQPRRHFDDAALAALADSIRELGVLQPVLVRPDGADTFELIAGERRWRAAQRAGMRMIPALIRHSGDQGALEQAIVENLHRQDLNPLEEAAAYQQLAEDFGLTQEEVANRVGKSRSAVANTLRLLQLPASVQRLVGEGTLSAGHARALLALEGADAQRRLAVRVVDEELTVRQTEEAVKAEAEGAAGRGSDADARRAGAGRGPGGGADGRDARAGAGRSAAVLAVEELLSERLDTQVEVRRRGSGGQVVVRFADDEDLDRIVRLLLAWEQDQDD